MFPLLLCSITALGIIIERSVNLIERKIFPQDIINLIDSLIQTNELEKAYLICEKRCSPLTNIIKSAIENRQQGQEAIKEAILDAGRQEVPSLEKNLVILGTIAGISPLLGLLGTVTGMIKVFRVISAQGIGGAGALAGGISEALITTATGLAIAIPSLVAYNYFVHKVEKLVITMEKHSLRLINKLRG